MTVLVPDHRHGYNALRPAEGWVVWWRYRSLEVCLQLIAQRAIAHDMRLRAMQGQRDPVPPPPAALGITDHEMQMGRRRQHRKHAKRKRSRR